MRTRIGSGNVTTGTASVALSADPVGTRRGVLASDLSADSQWPLVERRRRKTDRRQYDHASVFSASETATNGPGELHTRTDLRASNDSHPCTDREQQIVELLRQGLTNKQIAQQLGIREDTVKKHLQHIYDKLGVRRRALVMLGRAGARKSSGRDPALP